MADGPTLVSANRSVTIGDVAVRAGVSKSAVSLAFNHPARLSEVTRQNIMQAAEDLGYVRDPAARMLRTRRTNSLGLLLPQRLDRILENPYYSLFLRGVGQVCHREGLTLLLIPPLRGSMLKAIPYAAVDGFLVAGLESDRGEVAALRQRRMPFVLVDSPWHEDTPSVDIDDGAGVEELVKHLLRQGHRKIAFVAFETGVEEGRGGWKGAVQRRMLGAAAGLLSAGLTPDSDGMSIIETPCTQSGGVSAFHRLWNQSVRPTAIVAFSDIIAFGVLDAAREIGVRVPTDLSVSGFDDLTESAWTNPPLTTVRQPTVTKGRLAAEYLVEAIMTPTQRRHHQQRLETTLLLRDSTGAPPGA